MVVTASMNNRLKEGSIVVIKEFDDIAEHRFRVTDVWPDKVVFGGVALEGALKGCYGEPCYEQIKEIVKV